MNDVAEVFSFILKAEKLKNELRHSWTSGPKRQESVAEHSWLMALIAMTIFDDLGIEIDRLKVMKMIALHDLGEAIVGDIPPFEQHADKRLNKYAAEEAAMKQLTKDLSPKTAAEFMSLWYEIEANETVEAKLAQCMDKSEVLIQHIIADISTWDDNDYGLGPYNKDEYFDFNPFVREFKNYVNQQFWEKMEANDKLSKIKPEHLERHKRQNS